MKKIRTPLELNEALDQESSWRKREISRIMLLQKAEKNSDIREFFDRWGIVILYAHYEGFVKNSALALFNYVSNQGLKYKSLSTNYIVACSKASIKEAAASQRLRIYGEVVDFLLFNQEHKARIPLAGVVDTADNLSYRVLSDVFYTIGEPIPPAFELRNKIIDDVLLKNRNAVAHGNRDRVSSSDFRKCHDMVIEIVEEFKEVLENCAANKRYLRS